MNGAGQLEHVAVVVVTYNSASVIVGLLESLPAGLQGIASSLFIVDNGSTDDVVDVVRRLSPATVVETGRNGGYAAGINAGVAAAGEFTMVLVLNPDVRLDGGCVAELVRVLRLSGAGVVVPRLVDRNGALIESQRREPTILRTLADALIGARRAGRYPLLGENVTEPHLYEHEQTTDWAEGSTVLMSAECLAACGPWDERFFLYSEETDFMLRARDAGFTTRFVPTATATHLEGGSAGNERLWPLLVTNRVRLYAKRHGRVRTAAFWAAVTLRESTRAITGNASSKAAVRALTSRRRMRATPSPEWIAG